MVPIPPPPLPRSAPPGAPTAPVYPAPGSLTKRWRLVFITGWAFAIYGLGAAGQSGFQLGKPAWWWQPMLLVVPFVLPVSAAVAGLMNHRAWLLLGCAGTAALAASAVADWRSTPGVAAIEAASAVVGLLTTVSSIAGKMPGRPAT